MSDRRHALRRLFALIGLTLIALAAAPTTSQADPYGELTHFADKAGELKSAEPALGVDTVDGSLFVVDTVTEGKIFRLQKFENVGGTYKAVASTTFKPKDPVSEGEGEIQGVAIDPTLGRVYVLSTEERPGVAGKIDPFDQAASQLFAFSIKQSAGKLEPAEGTTEGVLTEANVLKPTSQKYGQAILEPGGIAVNPVNHQILITGYEDLGAKAPTAQEIPVVQAIESTGALATKWSDEKGFFEECGCINSPVVTSTGHILVLAELDEIEELPSNLASSGEVKVAYRMPVVANCPEEAHCPYLEKLTEFPGGGAQTQGAQMSIGPEGNIYVRDRIALATEGGFKNSGVMILSPTFGEKGFIGGASLAAEPGLCAVTDLGNAKPVVAAGKEPEEAFLLSRPENKPEKIIQFGKGGGNCPKGTATVPTAKAGGVELEKFPISGKVTFASTMTQANAVKVEWEFGDGSGVVTGPERQQETTKIEHLFLKAGTFTVVEKITTDNLATPTITKERKITVLPAPAVRNEKAKVGVEGKVTLEGEVNANFEAGTTCEFEYGPVGTFTKKVACPTPPGEEGEWVPEAQLVTGLTSGEYNFRLVARYPQGEKATLGEAVKFFIPVAGAPTAETLAATAVGATTATLQGSVNPKGSATTCKFEYGTVKGTLTKEAACSPAPGSGEAAVAVSAVLTGLTPSTTYYYKVVAEHSGAVKAVGGERELATAGPPVAPTAETGPASAITQITATLTGNVNPGGEPTTCEFEYGTPAKTVPCSSSPGSGREAVAVSAAVTGLTPGTTYHFKLLAKSSLGEGAGSSSEFSTLPIPAPTAVTGAASNVGESTATVTGTVNPNGSAASCRFLYGTTAAYGSEAPCTGAPGSGSGAVSVSAVLAGLTKGTLYHYRLVANGPGGSGEGADQQFSTAQVMPLPFHEGTPIVSFAAAHVTTVAKSGAFTVNLGCPKGVTQCAGTVVVKSAAAVAAKLGFSAKQKSILTLATASFTVAGGQVKAVTLRLSSKAKKLLAKLRTLRAKVTIVAHNPEKTAHTTLASLTLKKHR